MEKGGKKLIFFPVKQPGFTNIHRKSGHYFIDV